MSKRFKIKKTPKPGPKRDRLLKYLKELVQHENSITFLNKKRIERITILYELPSCVINECINEVSRWWSRRLELIANG